MTKKPAKRSRSRRSPPKAAALPIPRQRSARFAVGALLAAALLVLAGGWYAIGRLTSAPTAVAPADAANAEPGLIEKVASLYNDIYLYKQDDGNFMLSFGAKRLRYIESIIDPQDELDLPVEYTQSMTGAALAYAPGLDDAAIIGLGGGRTAWYLHKSVPDLSFTAVELDPEVARITDRYFGVRPEKNVDVAISDGRVWLTRSDKKFDIILVDAYRGPFVPFHLLTSEFYKLVADHLKPGGIAVQNVEPTTMLFDSAVATIKSAFAHTVFLYGGGNIVIVGYNGPEKDEATLQKIVAERQARYHFRYPLTEILSRRFTPAPDDKTAPLTDDFAPVEYLKAIARHNEKQT
jgi:spermidine synthase